LIDLDLAELLHAADPSDMLGHVAALPEHCRSAYDAAVALDLPSADGVSAVVVCGMGGSAVAGDVLRAVFRDRLGVPIEVNRGHELPAYAGPHTLVVVSSYSGETSETLSAFREARARGCRVIAVTSGGTLAAECGEARLPVVPVPGGLQPRAALGHLGFSALGALESAGLLPPLGADVDEAVQELAVLAERLGPEEPTERNPAKALAMRIGDKVPVIWGAEGIGAVAAMRWKTQLNENGKVPAFWASMSELDHNEVVGWVGNSGHAFSLIALRHDGEHPEIARRFPLSYDIARAGGMDNAEVRAAGRSALARLMSLVIVGDYTSVYLGLRRGHDPTPVEVLVNLKAALAGA
jgi:glucose/mannose-6-phosphate isomerase